MCAEARVAFPIIQADLTDVLLLLMIDRYLTSLEQKNDEKLKNVMDLYPNFLPVRALRVACN